ncbi:hypothetical protein, partial [Pedobacter sp. SYSU D00535]|uniref:hypothetical protein n=1 Tax=Pedobacter sp. SYSU D00535 TaxID=2810308 RepID=UPI001A962254
KFRRAPGAFSTVFTQDRKLKLLIFAYLSFHRHPELVSGSLELSIFQTQEILLFDICNLEAVSLDLQSS